MEWATGSRPRRAAIVGEGPADGAAVTPSALGLGIRASLHGPCQGAHATDGFFEDCLGLAVRLLDRLSGFGQGVQVTQWVGPLGAGLSDSRTPGAWLSGQAARQRHLQGLLHLTEQRG